MIELGQPDFEISLRYPYYMSELVVPPQDTPIGSRADSSINVTSSEDSSASSCNVDFTTDNSTTALKPNGGGGTGDELIQMTGSFGELVDCTYKTAGCTEKVPHGTLKETEHHENCQYRPIPCLMQHVCKQRVPYHNFLLHHVQHFIYPSFSPILNTSVVFEQEDFDCNQRWQPRWMNCYEKDFFVMILHKIPGIWYFWVWMLGTPEEAGKFSYDIEISKGNTAKVATFPVLSFRTSEEELEKRDNNICLSMTDSQVRRLSQIKENVVGSFDIGTMIRKVPSALSRFFLGEN